MKTKTNLSISVLAMLICTAIIIYSCKKEVIKVVPTISITTVTDIMANSAISGGNITNDGGAPVTSRGVCWSTNQNPTTADSKTTDGTGSGSYTSFITGLTPSTIYYVRAYATNSSGIGYGESNSFTSLGIETLRSAEEAYPGITGEIVTVHFDGEEVLCSKINNEYVYQGDMILHPSSTKGAAIDLLNKRWPNNEVYYTISGLLADNLWVKDAIQEYVDKTNLTFKERTNEPNYIEFIYDEGCSSEVGMEGGKQELKVAYWATAGNIMHEIGHAIGLKHEFCKSGRDKYVTIIWENIIQKYKNNFIEYKNSLNTPGFDYISIMMYDSWAFSRQSGVLPTIVINEQECIGCGTLMSPPKKHLSDSDIDIINTIYPTIPSIITTEVSSITTSTAISGGNVTSDGGIQVTARGVCWNTTGNPTKEDRKTIDGTHEGIFISNITGLNANTKYYVQAYATNNIGTAYANNQLTFTTTQTVTTPTVTTTAASSITTSSATVGGNVTASGGANVTENGVYWGTSPNPENTGTKKAIGSGTDSFSASLTELSPNTTYYVKAYAINSLGTGYASNTISFTTTASTIQIGQSYQGGIIFYIDNTGQHGLIAASTDQSTSIKWYNGTYKITGASSTAVGTGQANTTAIVNSLGTGNYAASLCNQLVLNGYSDWFLPSREELNLLFNLNSVNGLSDHDYWSSSESGGSGLGSGAWYRSKSYSGYGDEYRSAYARAIRVF